MISTAVVMLLSTHAQSAELSSTISFTNDYRFHGISQTAGDAAIQGSIDAAFDNGLYAGIWGSNVDFGDDANLEIDWYAGYGASITEDISWDATVFYYTYPGYKAADADFSEVGVNLNYKEATISYTYSNDYFNTSKDAQYVGINYTHSLNENIAVDLHAGHSFGSYWEDLDIGNYNDFSVGLSTSAVGVDVSLAYLFNDIKNGNDVSEGLFRNDDTILFTASRSF